MHYSHRSLALVHRHRLQLGYLSVQFDWHGKAPGNWPDSVPGLKWPPANHDWTKEQSAALLDWALAETDKWFLDQPQQFLGTGGSSDSASETKAASAASGDSSGAAPMQLESADQTAAALALVQDIHSALATGAASGNAQQPSVFQQQPLPPSTAAQSSSASSSSSQSVAPPSQASNFAAPARTLRHRSTGSGLMNMAWDCSFLATVQMLLAVTPLHQLLKDVW
jgi:hypothetical protein